MKVKIVTSNNRQAFNILKKNGYPSTVFLSNCVLVENVSSRKEMVDIAQTIRSYGIQCSVRRVGKKSLKKDFFPLKLIILWKK